MTDFNPELFLSTLALIGVVIVISALLSGFVERSGLPQVAVFLGLGATIGPYGLGLINIDLHSPILRVVGTLSLVLVLFTDAVSLNLREVRKHCKLSVLVLGPGTLLSAFVIAFFSWWLLYRIPGCVAYPRCRPRFDRSCHAARIAQQARLECGCETGAAAGRRHE